MSHDLIVASVSSLSNFEADQSNDRNVEDRKADKKNPRAPAATADGGGQPHAKRSTSGSFRERHEARDRTQSQQQRNGATCASRWQCVGRFRDLAKDCTPEYQEQREFRVHYQ